MSMNVQLKMARLKAGLSQHELAVKCGTSEATISKYETGRARAEEAMRQKLADALGVKSHELGVS